MRLCLVEDLAVAGLEPLTLTRAVYDLRLGCSTLGSKIAGAFGVGPGPHRRGAVIRTHLIPVQRQRDPHLVVNDRDWLARGPVVVVNSRWVPPVGFEPPGSHGPWVGLCDGQPACALVGPEDAVTLDPHGIDSWFERIAARTSGNEVGGEWIDRPWDLVARNGAYIERDFVDARQNGISNRHLATLALVGPSDLLARPRDRADRSLHGLRYHQRADRRGPERLGAAVHPRRGAVLHRRRDPALPRQHPRLRLDRPQLPDRRRGRGLPSFRATPTSITKASSATPTSANGSTSAQSPPTATCATITARSSCRSRGIRSPRGRPRWAASSATIPAPAWDRCSTRARPIGVMCNVLPAGLLLPKHVPSFTAVLYGRVGPGFSLEQMFATARIVMGRRGKTFDEAEEQLYRGLYEQTRLERERAFQRSHDRRADFWPVAQAARS